MLCKIYFYNVVMIRIPLYLILNQLNWKEFLKTIWYTYENLMSDKFDINGFSWLLSSMYTLRSCLVRSCTQLNYCFDFEVLMLTTV